MGASAEGNRTDRSLPERPATMVQFVDAVVAELDAGAPPASAVQAAGTSFPDEPVLARVARHVSLGTDVAAALREAGRTPATGALLRVAACVQVTTSTGAGLANALRRVADGLRDEQALSREVTSQLAAPRATARLLAGLPVVVWVMGYGLGADPVGVLLTTPYGWGCLTVGLALELLGLRWVNQLARGVAGT